MRKCTCARMIRASLAVAGAALVGFHGWLFAAQVAAGRLEDPWLVFRWIAAAILIATLVAVRRGGESIFGRKNIAIWVLAALLHGPAIASDLQNDFNSFALPETVATSVLQLLIVRRARRQPLAARRIAARAPPRGAVRYATVPVFVARRRSVPPAPYGISLRARHRSAASSRSVFSSSTVNRLSTAAAYRAAAEHLHGYVSYSCVSCRR